MDTMLANPKYHPALLRQKKNGAEGMDAGATSSSSSSGGQQQRATSALQNSIQSDLQEARNKGKISKDDATRLMLKMSLLKQVEEKASRAAQGSPDVPCSPADHVGCTAVCVLISHADIVCANTGDSRAVLCRKGKAVALSQDHKPNDPVERRRIEGAGGNVKETSIKNGNGWRVVYRINGDLNLSRCIGDLRYKKRDDLPPNRQIVCSTPDIHIESRSPYDEFIVLACDGVWDVKTNDEVCRFIRDRLRKGQGITSIIETLLDDCITTDPKVTGGLGADNMTCVVIKLHSLDGTAQVATESRLPQFPSEQLEKRFGCLPFRCIRR